MVIYSKSMSRSIFSCSVDFGDIDIYVVILEFLQISVFVPGFFKALKNISGFSKELLI